MAKILFALLTLIVMQSPCSGKGLNAFQKNIFRHVNFGHPASILIKRNQQFSNDFFLLGNYFYFLSMIVAISLLVSSVTTIAANSSFSECALHLFSVKAIIEMYVPNENVIFPRHRRRISAAVIAITSPGFYSRRYTLIEFVVSLLC